MPSEYIERYLKQAKIEGKSAKETWLKEFFQSFHRELKERSSNHSPGDKYIVTGAFSVALRNLIPKGRELIPEVGIKEYIEMPKEESLVKLLSSKRVDFVIKGKNSSLLIEFKSNVQFNDISAAMVEMQVVKKFQSKKLNKISTASLHLFPYKTNVEGLRSLNSALGNPLDNIWVLCTPELEFDLKAIRAFRKEVGSIVG